MISSSSSSRVIIITVVSSMIIIIIIIIIIVSPGFEGLRDGLGQRSGAGFRRPLRASRHVRKAARFAEFRTHAHVTYRNATVRRSRLRCKFT